MSLTKKQAQQVNDAVRQLIEARSMLYQANRADVAASSHLNSVLTELTDSDDITPGWMMAPFEPTGEMIDAAIRHLDGHLYELRSDGVAGMYQAMLSAVQFQSTKRGGST